MKSGFIAILGRPNVGKSTLLNYLVGTKVSIVSPKPQTTRFKILGVKNLPDAQLVFIDTPGVHNARSALNKYMVKTAIRSIKGVDLIYLMIEPEDFPGEEYSKIMEKLSKINIPVFLVINKIDRYNEGQIKATEQEFRKLFPFKEVVKIAALTGKNVDLLVNKTIKYLHEGPEYFPKDMLTDRPLPLLIAEAIREKLFLRLGKELPYSAAVNIEEMKEKKNGMLYVRAVISVARESQKGIVIGKKGKMLKRIGTEARIDIQQIVNKPVYLDIFVHTEKDWPKLEEKVKKLGYRISD